MYVLTAGVCVVVYGGDQEPVRWWVLYVAKFAFLNVTDIESSTRQHIQVTAFGTKTQIHSAVLRA